MSYNPTEWSNGDVITAEKLNKLENGVKDSSSAVTFYGELYWDEDNEKLSFDFYNDVELSDIANAVFSGANVSISDDTTIQTLVVSGGDISDDEVYVNFMSPVFYNTYLGLESLYAEEPLCYMTIGIAAESIEDEYECYVNIIPVSSCLIIRGVCDMGRQTVTFNQDELDSCLNAISTKGVLKDNNFYSFPCKMILSEGNASYTLDLVYIGNNMFLFSSIEHDFIENDYSIEPVITSVKIIRENFTTTYSLRRTPLQNSLD